MKKEEVRDLIVTVMAYKGQINYDKQLNVTSDHQPIKLKYGRLEWKLFLETAKQLQYSKLEAIYCLDVTKRGKYVDGNFDGYFKTDLPEGIQDELALALGQEDPELTPEQQKIKDLEARIDAMSIDKVEGKPAKEEKTVKVDEVTESNDDDLEALREEYTKVFGKKPHHAKKAAGLRSEIDEKQNS